MNLTLHHFAYDIRPNTLEFVVGLFKQLGCTISYREKDARWCRVKQKPKRIDIQLIETKDKPISTKINTHIAFLSDNPENDIKKIKKWVECKKKKFVQGSWSKKELWFDLPEVFINFVIEIMHTSVVQ